MAKPVSSYEAHAWQIFREQCFRLFLVEIKLLGREHGAADIWWPGPAALLAPLGLVIMIDGEGHSTKPHHGKPIAKQQAVDRKFDHACLDHGFQLLRLDYRGKLDWPELMQHAVMDCTAYPHQPFAMYSASYVH